MKFLGEKEVVPAPVPAPVLEESEDEAAIEITPALYMKAGFPIVYIRTEENERAVNDLRVLLSTDPIYKGKSHFGEWKSTTGLLIYKNPAPLKTQRQQNKHSPELVSVAKDILASLNYVEKMAKAKKTEESGAKDPDLICCFHNIKYFLTNFIVVQKLRDIADPLKKKGNHLFIIGPSLDIPPELTSIVSVYDLAIPTVPYFVASFRGLCENYKTKFKVDMSETKVTAMATAAVGMTALQGENAISLSLAMGRGLDPHIVTLEKEQAIKRSEIIEFVHASDTMNTLGGFDVFKEWLGKRADTYTAEAMAYGLRFPKGVLILGIPGTGKSLCVKSIASFFRIPLIRLDMGRIFKSLVGASEERIRGALKTAVAVSPVVLWIDEIDRGMAGSSSSGKTDSGTTSRVMATILTFMQENKAPVFFAATANEVENLDPALLRKGRFTEVWGVIEPNEKELEEIWKIHIGVVRPNRVGEFDYPRLVAASVGYTGAEVEGIVEEAMHDAWNDGKREMVTQDLVEATGLIVPQSIMSMQKIDALRTWMKTKVRFVSKYHKANYAEETEDQWRQIKESIK